MTSDDALNGYRAAISYLAADSWDGCSDCIDMLRAARTADIGWDWSHDQDRVASELAKIRPHIPTAGWRGPARIWDNASGTWRDPPARLATLTPDKKEPGA